MTVRARKDRDAGEVNKPENVLKGNGRASSRGVGSDDFAGSKNTFEQGNLISAKNYFTRTIIVCIFYEPFSSFTDPGTTGGPGTHSVDFRLLRISEH